jgi:Carboxypeptidase regulatory-like domain
MRKRHWLAGLALLALTASLNCLHADELGARIRGTVTDPSGAGVPDAQVTATNSATHVSVTVPSAGDGTFQFLSLPVGRYTVAVSKAGFRNFTARDIQLALNQVYDLSVSLELGQVSESVQVDANPVQVETTTTQLGTVISGDQIVNLPLNGRNWTSLEQLVPGVVAGSDRFGSAGAYGAYATNGSESQQNSFLINGADSMDLRLNAPLVVPSPDAIGEFNLIDSTINPEYGRNSGGILNAIIKSGTNEFHGDAFEFYRDTFLNARNFFQTTAPVFHQNQYGGTLGGPIWKDKTFFFVSYQGTRNRAPDTNSVSNTTTVLSQDQRNGFFPNIASSTTPSPVALVGESGATYAAGTPYNVLFPTGHIPVQNFNSISNGLLKYVPAPNLGNDLFSFNPAQVGDQEQGIARVDHTFGSRDSLWTSLFFQHQVITHDLPFGGSSLPGFGEADVSANKQFIAAWNHTFNPTTLNEFRVSYLRFNYDDVSPINPAPPSAFGFTGIHPQFTNGSSAPYVSLNGYFNLGFSPFGPQPVIENTYQLDDNFSKVAGSHTLKFGFDGRRYEVAYPYEAFNNGYFAFNGLGGYSTGDPGADFLLGIPDSYVQSSGGVQTFRTYEIYLYAQDSWKATKNLTINYGAGYQIDTPLENHAFGGLYKNCFRPGQQSSVFPTAPEGLLFPGDNGCSLSGYYQHYGHIAPRFGFAYAPDWGAASGGAGKKLVIRGGFGVYFNRTEEELSLQDLSAVPFSLTSLGISGVGGSPTFANPFIDIASGQALANPFPFAPPTKGQTVDFSQFLPLSINVINPNFTDPYAMNFNLNIQRELPGAMILQIGYVGAQGRHLELAYEGNPISSAGVAACAADQACIADRGSQAIDYPSHSLYAPGDIFASVGTQASEGVSSYHSLQISLNKRLTRGLMFQAAYTWSHSIDDTSGYEASAAAPGVGRISNPYNFALNRGDSTFDARHRFVVNYNYDLPALPWHNAFARYALSGWRISGITTLQTGFPVYIGDTSLRSLQCPVQPPFAYYGCWDAPNVNGTVGIYDPRNATLVNAVSPGGRGALPNYYFNPNAFSQAAIGTLGNEGRNNFHGPGINQTDLALVKLIKFSETRKIEMRLESFNTFNHTQFQFASTILSFSDINTPRTFGRTLSAAPGRVIQLGAKIYF